MRRYERDDAGWRPRCGGFTLIELLVVIAIIVMLMGMLFAGVNSVREAGRQTTCKNNIGQMAKAFQLHENTLGSYPDGGEGPQAVRTLMGGSPTVAPAQHAGWAYQILPYMERMTVWNIVDFPTLAATQIEGYACPSRRSATVIPGTNRGSMDYAGNAGTDNGTTVYGGASTVGPCNECNPWGVPGNGRDAPVVRRPNGSGSRTGPVTAAKIQKDGLSNTLLLGEKCLNVGLLGQSQTDDDGGWVEGYEWDTVRWGFVPPSADFIDANPASATSGNQQRHQAFGSSHAGMFFAALCDGSVRPIPFDISLDTFQRLCSRNDGQMVDQSSF